MHYDFGLYPREAGADAQGLWQIDETVTRIAFSALASAIGEMTLTDALSGSLEKVGHVLAQALRLTISCGPPASRSLIPAC